MDAYRTEEEQVEALKAWWDENGRSIVVAIVIALAAGFGWQGWKSQQEGQAEAASDMTQDMPLFQYQPCLWTVSYIRITFSSGVLS